MAVHLTEQPLLLERQQVLLEEAEVAPGLVVEPGAEAGCLDLAVARFEQLVHRRSVQLVERQVACAALAADVRAEPRERVRVVDGFGVVGQHDGDGVLVEVLGEGRNDLRRRLVDPVRLVDHEHQRPVGGDPPQRGDDVVDVVALLLLVVAQRRGADVGRGLDGDAGDRADAGDQAEECRRDLADQLDDLARLVTARALVAQRREESEAGAERYARPRTQARSTHELHLGTGFGDPVGRRLQQLRLPAPRRSGQEDDAAASGGGVRGGGGQRVQLPLAADHGGGHGQVIPPPPNGCKRAAEGYPGLRCPTWP